jgi:hypothetical protein
LHADLDLLDLPAEQMIMWIRSHQQRPSGTSPE